MSAEVIIETGVGATLSLVCDQVLAGAGLAVLKGSVGIGKTFALEQIVADLREQGHKVALVTASEATAGNINAFLRSILGDHVETGSSSDAEEAVWALLAGRPFMASGTKSLLIVDEAQKLAGRVLETIRGLWDRGDAARLGKASAPAFGCVMVGNPTFMGKGGAQRTAAFQPLLDRLTHNMTLPRPSRSECEAFAATLFDTHELQKELAETGVAKGTLRSMATAARSAQVLAGDGPVLPAHLRQAFKMMGGR